MCPFCIAFEGSCAACESDAYDEEREAERAARDEPSEVTP